MLSHFLHSNNLASLSHSWFYFLQTAFISPGSSKIFLAWKSFLGFTLVERFKWYWSTLNAVLLLELLSMYQLKRYLSVSFITFLPTVFTTSGFFLFIFNEVQKPKGQVWEKIYSKLESSNSFFEFHIPLLFVTWLNSSKFQFHVEFQLQVVQSAIMLL